MKADATTFRRCYNNAAVQTRAFLSSLPRRLPPSRPLRRRETRAPRSCFVQTSRPIRMAKASLRETSYLLLIRGNILQSFQKIEFNIGFVD